MRRRRYAAIIYTRDCLEITYSDWEVVSSNNSDAPAGKTGFSDKLSRFAENRSVEKSWDFPTSRTASKSERRKLAEQYIIEAMKYLNDECLANDADCEFLTISGYGPFLGTDNGADYFSKVADAADPPFGSLDLKSIILNAKDRFGRINPAKQSPLAGLHSDNVFVITDAAAIGIASYWALRQGTHTPPGERSIHTLAALVVGHGIGGAIVQEDGEIFGQAHHPELGHMPILHLDSDPLTIDRTDGGFKTQCDRGHDCLHGRASIKAMKERAKAFGTAPEAVDKLEFDRNQWRIQEEYLGILCASVVLFYAPTQIVLCGELIEAAPSNLSANVDDFMRKYLANYIEYPALEPDRQGFIHIGEMRTYMLVGALLHGVVKEVRDMERSKARIDRNKARRS